MEHVSSSKPTRIVGVLALAAGLGMAVVPAIPARGADVGSLVAPLIGVLSGQAAVREDLALAQQRLPPPYLRPGVPGAPSAPGGLPLDLNLSGLERAVTPD